MPRFLQPSLSSGELSPGMRGRVDLARHATSLGRARNFITKPTGGGAKRPGTIFRGRVKYPDRKTRLLPFVFSTSVKYLVELGHNYMRFWLDGVLVTSTETPVQGITAASPAVVTAAAHGYANGQYVIMRGVRGMTSVNDRTFRVTNVTTNSFELQDMDTTGHPAYISGGSADLVVEVASPYTEDTLGQVRFTQSADVMFLTHGSVYPRELRRLTATSFEMRPFEFKRGPFRGFNPDEAAIMAASGVSGVVTVTTNVDVFTNTMVGSLLYMEEKELRGVKPWASAERNVPIGATRRSDAKVYRAVSTPSSLGSMGTPYYVTGGVRPVHDVGRAFDGPQDVKDDGVNSYAVGVEWQFLHNTFGILKIQEYIDARTVKAVAIERIPDSLVGTAPTPSNEWDFTGDGSVTFSITGAASTSALDYRVTIDGVPIQSNPNYGGGGGVGGGGGGNPRPGVPDFDIPAL